MGRNNHEKYLIFHLLKILQPGMSQNSTGNGRYVNEFGLKMDKIGPQLDEMRSAVGDDWPKMDEIRPEVNKIWPEIDKIPPEKDEMWLKVAEIQPAFGDIRPKRGEIRREVAKIHRKWIAK